MCLTCPLPSLGSSENRIFEFTVDEKLFEKHDDFLIGYFRNFVLLIFKHLAFHNQLTLVLRSSAVGSVRIHYLSCINALQSVNSPQHRGPSQAGSLRIFTLVVV